MPRQYHDWVARQGDEGEYEVCAKCDVIRVVADAKRTTGRPPTIYIGRQAAIIVDDDRYSCHGNHIHAG